MRLFSLVFVISFVAFGAEARRDGYRYLRDSSFSILSEIPRRLQDQSERNVDTINQAAADSLPTINSEVQANIEDPKTIGYTVTINPGTTCSSGAVSASVTLDVISGQSTTEITSLTVQEGTESVGSCPTTFSGTFNFVMSASFYTVTGPAVFSTVGDTCTALSTTYSSTVNKPVLTGEVTMSGTIDGDKLSVDSASVGSISATCDNTTVSISGLSGSTDYSSSETLVSTDIGTEVKNYVSGNLTTLIQSALDTGIEQTIVEWGFQRSAHYITTFARASFGQTVRSFLFGDGGGRLLL
ncbi:expressed unknown protein [Seminavis robusta]|uniref:Uncharacterized protein n=1 Tax=Seminavis robusta TaxID=568900 RepID=A0A9N8ECG9_9STRA|nr:expressed unknown protein [Seminavis robusta]|eukprot:Sro888_g216430.1 n/a (298) ;mRNA; f:18138-19432